MYPIKFVPIYKEKVWGGNRLMKELLKEIAVTTEIGESWEIACHKEGTCKISNGMYRNKTLEELMHENSSEIFGKISTNFKDRFPLLVKFIDANDKLSVQVHPDDDYAMRYENDLGKTEMWYVVDAHPGAKIIYGLKKGVTKDDFIKAIERNDIASTLREVEVKKGDVIFIPAGTVYAIGKGILIAEIQQNSDVTYRVYDWDRVGMDGKPRDLHIDKALDVINFDRFVENPKIESQIVARPGYKIINSLSCDYFDVNVLNVDDYYGRELKGERFEILMCIDGEFDIEYGDGFESFVKGETILVPANIGEFTLKGQGRVLKTVNR